jgi:H+/gluconate symporter-like permease
MLDTVYIAVIIGAITLVVIGYIVVTLVEHRSIHDHSHKNSDNRCPTVVERGLRSSLAFTLLFVVCIAMVLLSIAVSVRAVLKILDTTPFMGIVVDSRGNRIPIQGYPQLGFGLASAILFTILTVLFGLHRQENRNAGNRR